MTEVIIFAGSDAWAHAKQWQEQDGRLAGDNVPPVWLGDSQLDELADLKIIDDGRYCVRLYKAGHIKPSNINAIGVKLAVAGVRDANYYPRECTARSGRTGTNIWSVSARIFLMVWLFSFLLRKKQKTAPHHWRLTRWEQASAAQSARYGGELAINADSDTVHHYNGVVWEPVQDKELQRAMAQIFDLCGDQLFAERHQIGGRYHEVKFARNGNTAL